MNLTRGEYERIDFYYKAKRAQDEELFWEIYDKYWIERKDYILLEASRSLSNAEKFAIFDRDKFKQAKPKYLYSADQWNYLRVSIMKHRISHTIDQIFITPSWNTFANPEIYKLSQEILNTTYDEYYITLKWLWIMRTSDFCQYDVSLELTDKAARLYPTYATYASLYSVHIRNGCNIPEAKKRLKKALALWVNPEYFEESKESIQKSLSRCEDEESNRVFQNKMDIYMSNLDIFRNNLSMWLDPVLGVDMEIMNPYLLPRE